MTKFFFSLLLTTAIAVTLYAQTPTYSNVDYVGKGSSKQMMDIYVPSGITTPAPLIVHIHGGAFLAGSKGEVASFKTFYNNGYICADINYRLSSDSVWPAQLYDIRTAIRYLKVNSAQYGIDTNRIGLIGESAGAHLVSILGTTGNYDQMQGFHLGSEGATSKVHAVVDLFGPTNFLVMDGNEGLGCTSANHNAANSPESLLLGCALPNCPDRVASADPMTYLDAADPAFFVSCGDSDCLVAPYSSVLFDSMLTVKQVPHVFELIPGGMHGGSFWHNTDQDTKYLNFFNKYLIGINGVEKSESQLMNFKLIGNFPNPFNPTTTIQFSATHPGVAEIHVFNVLGEFVYRDMVVCNSSGLQSFEFDATHLTSGTYIYTVNYATAVGGQFLTQTGKMNLIK